MSLAELEGEVFSRRCCCNKRRIWFLQQLTLDHDSDQDDVFLNKENVIVFAPKLIQNVVFVVLLQDLCYFIVKSYTDICIRSSLQFEPSFKRMLLGASVNSNIAASFTCWDRCSQYHFSKQNPNRKLTFVSFYSSANLRLSCLASLIVSTTCHEFDVNSMFRIIVHFYTTVLVNSLFWLVRILLV